MKGAISSLVFVICSIVCFSQRDAAVCERKLHGGKTKTWAFADSGFVMGGACFANDVSFLFDSKQRLQVRECKDGSPISTLYKWRVVLDKFGYNILEMKDEKRNIKIYFRIVFSRVKKGKRKIEELRLYAYDFEKQEQRQDEKIKYYLLRGTT